jgi:hypothetical protein
VLYRVADWRGDRVPAALPHQVPIHDDIGEIVTGAAVKIPPARDQTDNRLLGIAPDLLRGQLTLQLLLPGIYGKGGHVSVCVVDEDLLTRLEISQMVEDIRAAFCVHMTDNDRGTGCSGGRTQFVPTHQAERRYFHIAVFKQTYLDDRGIEVHSWDHDPSRVFYRMFVESGDGRCRW